jgi:hypothetical protein
MAGSRRVGDEDDAPCYPVRMIMATGNTSRFELLILCARIGFNP